MSDSEDVENQIDDNNAAIKRCKEQINRFGLSKTLAELAMFLYERKSSLESKLIGLNAKSHGKPDAPLN